MNISQTKQTELKQYYVYELVDSRSNEVFYVGKGIGQRGKQHELDAKNCDSDSEKLYRIQKIKEAGSSVNVRVIGRYNTEEQAFAVEATLIHWVYGLNNLANIQGGHGCSTIRNNGDTNTLEGIDIPKPEHRADGVYTQAMKRSRDENGIISFIENMKNWLEEQLDIGFTEPDISESNKTKIYSYFHNARIRIGVPHSKEPSLWLAVEPIDNSSDSKERFIAVCNKEQLKIRKNKKLARFPKYKGTKDLSVLLDDIKKMIKLIEG